jgi:rhamnosyltransferase
MKEVSAILLTYNAEKYIEKQIEKILNQTLKIELLVIDSSSTDNTTQILDELNVKYFKIKKDSFNHGTTRNLGLSLAKNEIVIFITQDALPTSSNSFEKLISPFKDKESNVSIVFGRQVPYPDTGLFGVFARLYNYPEESYERNIDSIPEHGIKTFFNSNSFASYKKSELLEIGGFPERIIMCEDAYVAAKLILHNKSIVYNSDAVVYHSHSYNVFTEFKRYFDIGVAFKQEPWMLDKFKGKYNQGIKYFIQELKFLLREKAFPHIPLQIFRTLAKFLGYYLGKSYERLPLQLIKIFSWNRGFWEKTRN